MPNCWVGLLGTKNFETFVYETPFTNMRYWKIT